MEARIILSNADFSANNIGKFRSLSDFTKKVLAKQTQYGEDSDEAQALDTFLAALTTAGYLGGSSPKLTFLAIPALAASHAQLLYNIASLDGSGYPTDAMGSDERTSENKAYGLYESGGKVIGLEALYNSEVTNAQRNFDTGMFSGISGQAIPSFSEILYLPRAIAEGKHMLINGASNYKIELSQDSFELYQNISGNNSVKAVITGATKGFFGLSYKNDLSIIGNVAGATVGASSTVGSPGNLQIQANSNLFRFYANSSYTASWNATASLIAFGAYLSASELSELKGLVDTLMSALHAS